MKYLKHIHEKHLMNNEKDLHVFIISNSTLHRQILGKRWIYVTVVPDVLKNISTANKILVFICQ